MVPRMLVADTSVRAEYLAGTWDYARGRVATDHPRYEEACSIADGEQWDSGWIRTWVDVVAVVEHGCWFDESEGIRVCEFFEKFLKHSKGRKWAGKPFLLIDWQKYDFIMPLYGWRRPADPDGADRDTRRYRQGTVWMPKKNGKSATASGLGLYHLMGDGEAAPEVYSAAGDLNQARIVHQVASKMVKGSEALSSYAKVLDSTKRILCEGTDGIYRALSAEADLQEGLDWTAVFFDELHVQKKRVLFDTLASGGIARDEPLFLSISTAGVYDPESIGWEQWEYCRKVREGIIEDWEFFALAYYTEKDDDWLDEANWLRANPSLGVTITWAGLRRIFKEAENTPGKQNMVRRYHLNQWTQQAERWLDIGLWQKCGGDQESLDGRECYAGLDLSSKLDLSSLGYVFPPLKPGGRVYTLTRNWMPADNIAKRVRDDKVPYDQWVEQGYLTATPGNIIDQGYIRKAINEDADRFKIIEMGFDEWNGSQIEGELEMDGIKLIELRQGYKVYNKAMKELEKLVKGGLLAHGGDPVLQWAVDNLCVQSDVHMNMKPAKKQSKEKIDPIVAVLMAFSRWLIHKPKPRSIYKGRLPKFI